MKNKKGENLTNRLSNSERFHCTSPSANMDQYPELMDFLPKDYQYHICSYKEVNVGSDHMDFEATLRMSLKSKEDILVWLKSMPVTWRVDYTRPTKGSKIIFKTEYRCQHNTKPRATPKEGRASKNTYCPAKLKVTLARTEVSNGRQSRSTDPHIPDYPTLVDIVNVHNHNIHVADAVRHQGASSKAVKQLTKLFEAGQSPSSALDVLNYDLLVQLGNDYLDEHQADETLEAVKVSAQEWDSMSHEFAAMVQSSERFQVAGSAFLKAFNRLKGNPSMMQSAMHMFGRYGACSLASKRAGALQRATKRAGPSIATQPTSVARQKVKLMGRRRLTQKMTKKNVATVDHRYSYPEEVKSVSSCRGVSQQPKIIDAPPPLT